jgi:hypothetical protein
MRGDSDGSRRTRRATRFLTPRESRRFVSRWRWRSRCHNCTRRVTRNTKNKSTPLGGICGHCCHYNRHCRDNCLPWQRQHYGREHSCVQEPVVGLCCRSGSGLTGNPKLYNFCNLVLAARTLIGTLIVTGPHRITTDERRARAALGATRT